MGEPAKTLMELPLSLKGFLLCPAPSPQHSWGWAQGEKAAFHHFYFCADESVLHLTFYYLMNLNVMTVKTKVTTAVEMTTPISAG